MVGELVLLTDISSICLWTNTLLVTLACIPLVLFTLLHKLIPRRRGELSRLDWNQDYFEQGFPAIAQPRDDSHQKNRVEDGEGDVHVPEIEDPNEAPLNKQT
jgi:hypothetical protein